jgi:SAM-dependent methyltransferase
MLSRAKPTSAQGGSWSSAAPAYLAKRQHEELHARLMLPFIVKHLENSGARTAADLGCGDGWLTEHIAALGIDVYGVEQDAAMLSAARKRQTHARFFNGDLESAPDAELTRVEAIVAHMVAANVGSLGSLITFVGRLLSDDGILILTFTHPAFYPLKNLAGGTPFVYTEESTFSDSRWGSHIHYHRPISSYLNGLFAAGLTIVEVFEPSGGQPSPGVSVSAETVLPSFIGIAAKAPSTKGMAQK